jgi:hypothetical protein
MKLETITSTVTVKSITELIEKSDTFKFKQLWFDTDDEYGKEIGIQFSNKNVEKLNGINPGDTVEIKFDIQGREWNGTRFTTLSGWYVKKLEAEKSEGNSLPF